MRSAVIDEVDGLIASARSIRQGLETELALAVDVMVPSATVAPMLRDFQEVFPTVDLRLHVEALGGGRGAGAGQARRSRRRRPGHPRPARARESRIGSVELVPVAAPSASARPDGQDPPGRGQAATSSWS